jgi:hypothetical protein
MSCRLNLDDISSVWPVATKCPVNSFPFAILANFKNA